MLYFANTVCPRQPAHDLSCAGAQLRNDMGTLLTIPMVNYGGDPWNVMSRFSAGGSPALPQFTATGGTIQRTVRHQYPLPAVFQSARDQRGYRRFKRRPPWAQLAAWQTGSLGLSLLIFERRAGVLCNGAAGTGNQQGRPARNAVGLILASSYVAHRRTWRRSICSIRFSLDPTRR